jgi:hypothetical protein
LNPAQIIVPKNEIEVVEILQSYSHYMQQMEKQIRKNAYDKLHDWNLAEKMAKEITGV